MKKITPFLWFDNQALEAARLYVSIFKNSKIHGSEKFENSGPNENETVQVVSFELDGQQFQAMNAGPLFKFNEAISFTVDCKDQAEVDYYWNSLIADGGEESQCGWLKDKFGLSWQIIPEQLTRLMSDPDPVKSQRVMHAMLHMKKIDIAKLQESYNAG